MLIAQLETSFYSDCLFIIYNKNSLKRIDISFDWKGILDKIKNESRDGLNSFRLELIMEVK